MPTSTYEVTKTYTDNPFIDLLLYYSKVLAFGAVIKNQENADKAETSESVSNGDIMIACTEGTAIFGLFDYTEDELKEVGITDPEKIKDYIQDKYKIPNEYRDALTKIGSRDFLNNYTEYNNYYRMLCGLPNIGDYGIPVRDYEYLMPDGNIWNATYIHEINTDGCKILEAEGVLDVIRNDYPTQSYLNFLTCGITPYKARKAYEFQLLYLPSVDDDIIKDRFEETYENNRLYVMSTFYTEAFKMTSDYYDNFVGLIIMLLTIIDIVSEAQQDIIKKDILDERCVKFIFETYGVPYYKSIPLKYQKRICKNLNLLIRDKSSAQCMFDLISLFGANTVTIFKYFLLKDRKLDQWGDYIYNETIDKVSKVNDIVQHADKEIDRESNNIAIPFPFDHFLEKGNVMVVWADGHKLEEGTDYNVIDYNELELISSKGQSASKIKFDFYYDIRTIDNDYTYVDDKNSIHVDIKTTMLEDSNVIYFTLPYNRYLLDGNDIIVAIGGTWLNKNFYTIDQTKNTITIDKSYEITDKRNVNIIFVYGTSVQTKYSRVNVRVLADGQKNFDIPEPFTNYCSDGNSFFVTSGNTFIDSDRYTINENKLSFTDETSLKKGRNLTFNFVYSYNSIYTPLEIKDEWETITATEPYQYTFEIHPPIKNYIASGYKIFCKIHGNYLDEDMYDVYYSTLAFRTQSIGLQPGDTIEVEYVYGPYNEDTGTTTNIAIDKRYVSSTVDKQSVYTDIPFPKDNFFEHGGYLLVDVYGFHLKEGTDYTISEETKTLTLTNTNIFPGINRKINLTFIYNIESSNAVKMTEYHTTIDSDDQTEFPVILPFYPYYQTGNGYIVIYDSLIIPPEFITEKQTSLIINNVSFKQGHELTVLYIYNNKYLTETNNVLEVEEHTVNVTEEVTNDLTFNIPVPFDDFITHGWPYFVDHNGEKVDSSLYYDMDNKFSFVNTSDIANYDNLTFTFIYVATEDYLKVQQGEDNLLDFDLKFIGVPLTNDDIKYHNKYIMAKQNVLPYDTTTMMDKFWDGVGSEDDIITAHERVKLEILNKKFNYQRTKYFGLNHVFNIAEMSFQISYFYNLIFDDWFKEENLTVELPNIESGYPFKLGHVFAYLLSLSYLYSKIDDSIIDIPSNILYVKGFNMHADLEALKQYVLDQRRNPDDYNIWDFEIPEEQLGNLNDLLNLFQHDRDVYNRIVNGMFHCRNHDIYKIWKKFFDSLMVWKYNLDYFKLNNGQPASSYREFLQEKSAPLYRDIIALESIDDQDMRNMSIIDRVDDVVYLLEQYFNSETFSHIYDKLPGVSQEALMDYVYTMINFFKSYKIVLRSKGDYIVFSLQDPSMTAINITDIQESTVEFEKPECITIEEHVSKGIATSLHDTIGLSEKLSITEKIGEGEEYTVHIVQTDHQTITVYANDIPYTEDFTCPYGTEIYCYVVADKGFTAGSLNYSYLVIRDNVTIEASSATFITYTVAIIQSEHQLITVYYNGREYTNSFTCPYGSEISATIEADQGWVAGELYVPTNTVTENITIHAEAATERVYNIHINSSENQTVKMTVYYSGYADGYKQYSEGDSFTIGNGARYEINITPDDGYIAGSVVNYPASGNITDDMDIFVTDAAMRTIPVHIVQTDHQTIIVTINNVEYTQTDFEVPIYSIYTVRVEPEDNYTAGALNNAVNGIIDSEITFTAKPAIIIYQPLVVKGTITVDSMPFDDITSLDCYIGIETNNNEVWYHYEKNNSSWVPDDPGYQMPVRTGGSVQVTFNYSDRFNEYFDTVYKDGTITTYTIADDGSITIDLNLTIKKYTVYIMPTPQQTLTVKFSESGQLVSTETETVSKEVSYGETYTAETTVIDPKHYKPGDITVTKTE